MRTRSAVEHPTLDTIVAAYSAVVIERQLQLGQVLGEGAWSLDLQHGVLSLGGRELAVVALAHTDPQGGTWRWAWPARGPAAAGSTAGTVTALIDIGQRFDVPELATGTLRLSAVHDGGQGPGHTLAVAACGLLAARGYFPAPYDGGTAWLLITDPRLGLRAPDARRAVRLITAAAERFPHDNRLTVETYLGVRGVPARDDGDAVLAEFPDGTVRFVFDAAGRLVREHGATRRGRVRRKT